MYGQRIKEIRQEKGLTQSQLAEMLSTTQSTVGKYEREEIQLTVDTIIKEMLSTTQSTVGKYEREEIQLTVDTIIKICKVFEVSADYLLGLED